MNNQKVIKYLLVFIFLIVSSCTACRKSNKEVSKTSKSESDSYLIDKIQFDRSDIKIFGKNLNQIDTIKLKYNDSVLNLDIVSKNNESYILRNVSSNISFKLLQALIIENANASESIPINTELCGTLLNLGVIDCSIQPKDFDVLTFDQQNNRWIPKSITTSSINYRGLYDASLGVYPDSTNLSSGSYYIVSKSGTIDSSFFDIGDWIIFNGTTWDKINNSNLVKSVFGRTGDIVAQKDDYALSMLKDVDLTSTINDSDVLMFDNATKKWKAKPFTNSGGNNLNSTDDLIEGSNNLYFKENRVLDSILGNLTLTNSEIINTDSIKISIGKLQGQLNNKENLIISGSSNQYLKGDKTWADFSTDVLTTPLAGFNSTTGTISTSDSIISAIGKLSGNNGNYVTKTGNNTITGLLTANTPGGFFAPKASGIDLTELINVAFLNDFFSGFFSYTANSLNILREKVGINKSSPRGALDVSGQIATSSFTDSSGNIDWSKGNVVSSNFDCTSSLNFANLLDGGSYTIAITGTGTSQCSFNPIVTGSDSGTVFFKFNPANSTRTANTHTIYSIVRIGNIAYVSWITGF